MDVWVVAAAAGAGYIAQHWKNLLRSRHDFPESSLSSPSLVRNDSLPLLKQVLDNNCSSPVETPRNTLGESAADVASTSRLGGENLGIPCDSDVCKLTSGVFKIFNTHDCNELYGDQGGSTCDNINEIGYESSLPPSTTELAFSYGSARKKNSLRSRRKLGHLIKPLNSLESCLMAQLYDEHGEGEDYFFSTNASPWTPTARPFVVTDGSKIISRGNSNSLSTPRSSGQHKLQDNLPQMNTVFGVPQLPDVGSTELQTKAKVKDHPGRSSDPIKLNNERHSSLQGSSHAVHLFYLGISVGILASFWSNRKEMDKLNELLRQSENLVQDLHEELEMKDSLTVKELISEDCESQDTHNDCSNNGALHTLPPKGKLDEANCNGDCQSQKTEEGSMSKIEAELEAELERLESSMNSNKLERKLSELVELDPDLMPDVAEGELRIELFSKGARGQPYADQDGSATATPHPVNYAVSPRELSLRLHEVLQLQLEERVKELETALHNSERKLRYMEAELVSSWRDSSNSEGGSSSTHGSPVTKVNKATADEPVVINLSGEALDAYNEAFDVFSRLNESEEDDVAVASGVKDNHHQETCQPCEHHNFDWIKNGSRMDDESEDDHDEMEKLLIRHIVEKARKGSPAVLNVQRALYSLDDN